MQRFDVVDNHHRPWLQSPFRQSHGVPLGQQLDFRRPPEDEAETTLCRSTERTQGKSRMGPLTIGAGQSLVYHFKQAGAYAPAMRVRRSRRLNTSNGPVCWMN
jgi:hypothetical protein